ncbi:hypothetical protein Poli38472_014599 [Pythium oligandrum]|uniref:Uncharacterized protein n=1 Tax=Pythium oligandrum TaxID=41045 RepID=A0A8K1CQQ3_PYTOL|nr:hypothetical protein Poli38472_014599 [Pythium oligandrum]|eukprot:TMW66623.1 hypothetical protein Poli38472_014599 [Pythium oligandrum]
MTTQCRGTAKKTGKRCEIKFELNENGLCKYHKNQTNLYPADDAAGSSASDAPSVDARSDEETRSVASSAQSAATQCHGTATKTGKRCEIKFELNENGLCKYHKNQTNLYPADDAAGSSASDAPSVDARSDEETRSVASSAQSAATQCHGTATKTGKRCEIKFELNENGLCKYHKNQTNLYPADDAAGSSASDAPSVDARSDEETRSVASSAQSAATQCHGTATKTGKRCEIKFELNENGLCKYHKNQTNLYPADDAAGSSASDAPSVDARSDEETRSVASSAQSAATQCRGRTPPSVAGDTDINGVRRRNGLDPGSRLPPLWSVTHDKQENTVDIRILSGRSRVCVHHPIVLKVPRRANKTSVTVVVELASACSGLIPGLASLTKKGGQCNGDMKEYARKMSKLLKQMNIENGGSYEAKGDKAPEEREHLHRLLKLWDSDFDVEHITNVCNLECVNDKNGDPIWVTRDEADTHYRS